MDFGRLENISNIECSLPPDHKGISKVLGNTFNPGIEIYVGCPIWADKSWVGKIYPKNAKEKDFLSHYSRQFNSIELNATHYKIPDEAIISKWRESVSEKFKFCPKVPQVISHSRDILMFIDNMHEFIARISQLKENLGTVFLQLSPYFNHGKLASLIKFLDSLPKSIDLSVELRHPSWFDNNISLNILSNYLYKNKLGLVITDVSGRRDVLHQRLTNKTAFIRFTGNNLHPTDYKRMDEWVIRLKKWIEMGLEKLYFFIHTANKSLNPELVCYFIERFNEATDMYIKPPLLIVQSKQEKLL